VFVTALTTALSMVVPQESGLASGVVNTFHEVGGSIGVAVGSTLAAAGIVHAVPGGFARAFTGCFAAAAAATVLALVLVPPGRARTTGVVPHH
jgi:hypothetical protein